MFPIKTLDPQQRHDYILKTYILNKTTEVSRRYKRDIDVIKENHKFLWEDDDVPDSWERRLAKKYYDKLFKEYCIADLSRYKENKVALRWRTEQEVVTGKGQFQCGSRRCIVKEELRSWEVNFGYLESGEKKNVLIKLRLCPDCSKQLNYTSRKREVKRQKHVEKHQKYLKRSSKRRKEYNDSNDEIQSTSNHLDNLEMEGNTVEEDHSIECSKTGSTPNRDDILDTESDVWTKKQEIETEKIQREEEFEKYLEDLLL